MDAKKQIDIFSEKEADQWFVRNKEYCISKKQTDDAIYLKVIELLGDKLSGKSTLEVGCSNGYRADWLKQKGAKVCAFDPSQQAIEAGRARYNMSTDELQISDAHKFFVSNASSYDLIIFAHSLYLVPPEQIPEIVSGAINSLNDDGFILLFDFDSMPQRQNYHHHEGLYSYKAKLDTYFTWFPMMRLVSKEAFEHNGEITLGNPKEDCAMSVIRKISVQNAYPELVGEISL